MKTFPASQLIINADGSAFHLHLQPQFLADKIILVGDQNRVDMVASFFDEGSIECDVQSREFHTITGRYQGKRISCISTGIGTDNCDIVMNEIDALANIDFKTRTIKPNLRTLEIVRLGTCGGLQPNTPEGTFVASEISIGFDGLLNFYAGRDEVCDKELESAFLKHQNWHGWQCIAHPYAVHADAELTDRIASTDMVRGITVACGGFYGPQGRRLRLPLADAEANEKIMSFEYKGHRITNFEMESSALAGLSLLLGHKATTCCMVIANRLAGKANPNYKNSIDSLIKLVVERI